VDSRFRGNDTEEVGSVKICIVCSSGGHLVQSLFCLDAFKGQDVFLATYDTQTLANFRYEGVRKTYFIRYLGDSRFRVALMLLLAFFSFMRIFLKERPDVIFSTGSEIALPAFLVGKYLFRTKLIFLESLTRVKAPSLTAKTVFPFSDLFLVQSEKLLEFFDGRARYVGRLL
jgi:beta-1,4-N-acetylglucosaminyltransferase